MHLSLPLNKTPNLAGPFAIMPGMPLSRKAGNSAGGVTGQKASGNDDKKEPVGIVYSNDVSQSRTACLPLEMHRARMTTILLDSDIQDSRDK